MISLLLRLAESIRADLQSHLSDISGTTFRVQGASLEIDRYWLATFLFEKTGRPPLLDSFSQAWWSRQMILKWDTSYRPDDWHSYCKSMGIFFPNSEPPNPIIIRVFLESQNAPINDFGNTSKASKYVSPASLPLPSSFKDHAIVYEMAPPASALNIHTLYSLFTGKYVGTFDSHMPAAISVGRRNPDTAGSLNGVISSGNPEINIIMGCAHVLGIEGTSVYSPGPFENRPNQQVATVRKHWIADLKKEQKPCNQDNSTDSGQLDLSVADVDAEWSSKTGLKLDALDAIRLKDHMEQDAVVYFHGKVSRKMKARISGVSIWKEIDTPDFGTGFAGRRCFRGLLELMSLDGDTKCVARPGDSGALVFDYDGSLRRWNGMIIASHGRRAIATIAEDMMEAVRKEYPNATLL